MDIDALASEFGSTAKDDSSKKAVDTSGVDIHGLAAEFGSDKKAKEIEKAYSGSNLGPLAPKPPISGFDTDTSNSLNTRPEVKGGANPRDTALTEGISNLPSNIGGAIGDNAMAGWHTIQSGIGDAVNEGKLGSGAKKVGVGLLQGLTAIPSGVVSQGITEPVTQLTGNPDIGDRAGFIAGSAIPIAPGAGAISKALPSNVALKDLIEVIGKENLPTVVAGMKANPRLGPVDLSPSALSMTQKLFTTEGDQAKNYLSNTSKARVATSKDAVEGAFDAAAGLPVNAVNKLKELATASKKVGNEQINPAVKGAGPVDLSPVIEHIDKQLKPGVNSVISGESSLPFTAVKKQLADVKTWLANKNEMRIDPNDLHRIQSAFRAEAENLLKSTDGPSRALGRSLMDVRNKIVDAIDEASPKIKINVPNPNKPSTIIEINGKKYAGDTAQEARANYSARKEYKDTIEKETGSYKPALSNYRDEKEIAEAFHDAYNGVLTNSKKLENRPEFTKEWFDGLTDFEKKAAIEGIRTRIDTEIGVAKNPSLAGTSLGKSAFNQAKMQAVLGKEETRKLLDTLEAERSISNTHNKLIEGSQTGMRLAGESKIALPEKSNANPLNKYILPAVSIAAETGNNMLMGGSTVGAGLLATGALGGAVKAGSAAKFKIQTALAKERNLNLAKYALPTEGPERDQLIKAFEDAIPGPKQSIMRRGASTLSRLIAP